MVPSRSTRKPLASASVRPAHRSESRTPSPTRGPVTDRGARPARVHLERRGDRGQLVPGERTFGQGQESQDPPALLRADGQPGDHQLVERAGQRRARQLAAGGEQLLGDERQTARALGDEQEQARRGAFALDPLDQRRQLVAIERRESEALGPRTGQDRLEVRGPRIVAGDDVGLVRADDRQPLVARDAREERDQRPRRGVGEVEVLEDQDDRVAFAETPEQAEDPFERPRLAPLGSGLAALVDRHAQRGQPRSELGQEPDDLGRRRPEEVGQPVVGQVEDRRPDGADDRSVRLVRVGGPGRRAEHGHRVAQRLDPDDRLVEEAGDADARGALEEERSRPAVGGVIEAGGELGERRFAPHEARARVGDGHAAF